LNLRGDIVAFFFAMKTSLIFFLSIVCSCSLWAQDTAMRVLFYNVENLFDAQDDPLKFDEDFTPDGKLGHTQERYEQKQENLSRVINAVYPNSSADLIGLCEVENKAVVDDLAGRLTGARKKSVVHYESPDQRGIDNALVYNKRKLKLVTSGLHPIDLGGEERPTRGILYAVFNVKKSNEQVVVFVNHWPSRYGGKEESEWKRMKASEAHRALWSKLKTEYPEAHLISMGDFNDHPDDESLRALTTCETEADCLVNLHANLLDNGYGTHAYKGEWGVLDQMLTSRSLLQGTDLFVNPVSGFSFKEDWMLYKSRDGEKFPSRSYGGSKYYGGFSDHLPVGVVILKKAP